jgi:Fe-S cluster assembly scaffold protein SufB
MSAQAGDAGFSTWFPWSRWEEVTQGAPEPGSVTEERKRSYQAFSDLPVEVDPLFRKYSSVAGLDRLREVRLERGAGTVRSPLPDPGSVLIVHDRSGTHLTLPDPLRQAGVSVLTVPDLWEHPRETAEFLRAGAPREEKFRALNSALFNRGVYLSLPDGLETPVRVKDVTVLSRPDEGLIVRRVLRPGRRSRLLYSEEVYVTAPADLPRLYSSAVEASPAEGSQLVYLTVHAPDSQTVSFYSRESRVSQDDRLGWIWAGFDGFRTVVRNESHLSAQGSEVEDLQVMYGDGQTAYNNFTEITHEADDTKGQSITRGIFKGQSRGTSRGMMRIQPDTRKVVSYLSEHAMLLSKEARSESVPGLEILSAKDVKATHSSSVAPIDPERIFYLESRGIPEDAATRMIAEGFLSAVLDRAPVEGLREVLYPALDARWNRRTILWGSEGALPTLPPLTIVGWGTIGDWRMDTKLRDTAGRG